VPDMLVRLYDFPDQRAANAALAGVGITCRRAESYERSAVTEFVKAHWPRWTDEALAAYSHVPPRAFVATTEAGIVGFACFDATRPAFFGPTGVDEAWRGRGIGRVLLWQCLEALAAAGYAYAIIGGVHGRESFYEEAAGAIVIPGSDPGIYRNNANDLAARPPA